MKKRYLSIALSVFIAVSATVLASSCDKNGKTETNTYEDVVKVVKGSPVCFIGGDYTDSSITKAEFTVNYDSKYDLTASLGENGDIITLKEESKTTADGVVSAVYSIESKSTVGTAALEFKNGDEVVDTVSVSVKNAYPSVNFSALSWSAQKESISYSHDPVILEVPEGYTVDGTTYYYFSYATDNEAGCGVPVKASADMVSWKALGTCLPNHGSNESEVKASLEAGTSEIQEVYEVISDNSKFSCYTLWAPDVVRAADGGYWLYGSWTTSFGSRRSVIFQCYSTSPVGPFEYKGIIVYSPNTGNDGKQSNAIDPSIFYDTDGNMYMSYGSFSDFRVIPLDSKTGLRKDGATFTVEEMTSGSNFYTEYYENYEGDEAFEELSDSEKYFGEMILKNTNIEGSVVNYYADVPVYTGDITKEDYDASKITYESNYYLMGSANSLSSNYNMRVFKSSSPVGSYTSAYGGTNGTRISGNYTWAKDSTEANNCTQLNHYVPGHNDLITTTSNENFIVYHNKVSGTEGSLGTQFLFTGLVAFNSNGDLLMSPSRYGGESLRKITTEEITNLSSGNFNGVRLTSDDLSAISYAEDYKFNADGTISGAMNGTWKLYGDNYIYINMDGCDYYGVVMPGVCTKADSSAKRGYEDNGGLVISAIGTSGNAQKLLFMQMAF